MVSISLTVHGATGGLPRSFPRASAAFIANQRRFELGLAPMMVNMAQPIGLSVSTLSWTLMNRMPRWSNSSNATRRWRVLRAKRSNFPNQNAVDLAVPRRRYRRIQLRSASPLA
jgi:hypothetical protein